MEKSPLRSGNNGNSSGVTSNGRERSGGDGGLLRANSEINARQTASTDFVLQWGNRKRLRCMKVQVKDDSAAPTHRTTVRVVRTDKDTFNQPTTTTATNNGSNHHGSGFFNLRQRPSPPPPPPPQRVLRYYYITWMSFFLFKYCPMWWWIHGCLLLVSSILLSFFAWGGRVGVSLKFR